jgi:hypothetical protein
VDARPYCRQEALLFGVADEVGQVVHGRHVPDSKWSECIHRKLPTRRKVHAFVFNLLYNVSCVVIVQGAIRDLVAWLLHLAHCPLLLLRSGSSSPRLRVERFEINRGCHSKKKTAVDLIVI